jgi:replicative DNA helicase
MKPLEAAHVAPQAPEMERAVLGAVLLKKEALVEVMDVLRSEVFYEPKNAIVWGAIAGMHAQRMPVDILTVTQELKRLGKLEDAGGAFYISQLTNGVASGKNVVVHAHHLLEHFIKREQIRIGSEMLKGGYDPTVDPFDSLAASAADIRILNEYDSVQERTMAEIVGEVVNDIGPDRGVPFGYQEIDQVLRAEPGTVTIIGARPAMGKTAFMMSSAWRQAQAGFHPYIAEMEMKDRNLGTRLVCGEVGVPVWKAKRRQLSQQDLDYMAAWHVGNGEHLGRLLINESSSMKVSSLAARLDRCKRKNGIDVVWVDYLSLLKPSTKQPTRFDKITAISNELRVLAKDLDLPFIVLCQLNRPLKGVATKKPGLTDLRDSGEIEQDAEGVAFLHRPRYYSADAGPEVEFIIAKNRDGEDCCKYLDFDGQGVRMIDRVSTGNTYNELPPY